MLRSRDRTQSAVTRGIEAAAQWSERIKNSVKTKFCSQWGAESSLSGLWVPAAGGDGTWAARTGSGPMRMCGDIFAAARLWRSRLLTTGHLSSPILLSWVRGTWRGGRGGGACGRVGVLRARRCHLRAGFQQCKSFVEMCTVRCCPLWHPAHCPMGTVPWGQCPGYWCGRLHHRRMMLFQESGPTKTEGQVFGLPFCE